MIRVDTSSGTSYFIDEEDDTITRVPGGGGEPDPEWPLARLRQDGESVKLLQVVDLAVGQPAVFKIDLGVENVEYTIRTTTPVLYVGEA